MIAHKKKKIGCGIVIVIIIHVFCTSKREIINVYIQTHAYATVTHTYTHTQTHIQLSRKEKKNRLLLSSLFDQMCLPNSCWHHGFDFCCSSLFFSFSISLSFNLSFIVCSAAFLYASFQTSQHTGVFHVHTHLGFLPSPGCLISSKMAASCLFFSRHQGRVGKM